MDHNYMRKSVSVPFAQPNRQHLKPMNYSPDSQKKNKKIEICVETKPLHEKQRKSMLEISLDSIILASQSPRIRKKYSQVKLHTRLPSKM